MVTRKLCVVGLFSVLALCAFVPGGEKVLYRGDSDYNHILVTEDDQGLRSLLFEEDGALQSVVKVDDPDYLDLPYVRAMLAGLALVEKPRRVLIVGLGGGTIPRFLHKHYPTMAIDVVDIDPKVVEVAKRFFGFREDEYLKAHVADGRKFIEACTKPYDLIFLDAFGCDNIPFHLATREFLQAVRKAVSPTGLIVANVWSRYSNPLYGAMVHTYQDVFEELYIINVRASGNRILVPMTSTTRIRPEAFAEKARALGQRDSFPYDLGDVVTFGFRRLTNRNFGSRVLTDAQAPKERQGERANEAVGPGKP